MYNFCVNVTVVIEHIVLLTAARALISVSYVYYGRPLSVSGRPCYILPMFFLFIFLWPPYSPALVNGGSRKFYTW